MDTIDTIRGMVCIGAGSLIGAIIGGVSSLDISMQVLIGMMCLDFITGVFDGVMGKSDKTASGGISSKAAFKGIVKKLSIIFLVAAATILAMYLRTESIKTITVDAMIASEGLSLLENLAQLGCPIPSVIKNVLDQLSKEDKNG